MTKMKIYTSYFSNFRNFPPDFTPVSISRFPPKNWSGLTFMKLAPSPQLLEHVKSTGDHMRYTQEFYTYLNKLNPTEIINELSKLTDSDKVILLCYETPEKFCHRHLVSMWLNSHNIESSELNQENSLW